MQKKNITELSFIRGPVKSRGPRKNVNNLITAHYVDRLHYIRGLEKKNFHHRNWLPNMSIFPLYPQGVSIMSENNHYVSTMDLNMSVFGKMNIMFHNVQSLLYMK